VDPFGHGVVGVGSTTVGLQQRPEQRPVPPLVRPVYQTGRDASSSSVNGAERGLVPILCIWTDSMAGEAMERMYFWREYTPLFNQCQQQPIRKHPNRNNSNEEGT
jgi:hypothetical protein